MILSHLSKSLLQLKHSLDVATLRSSRPLAANSV